MVPENEPTQIESDLCNDEGQIKLRTPSTSNKTFKFNKTSGVARRGLKGFLANASCLTFKTSFPVIPEIY